MEANPRILKDGSRFDRLFAPANLQTIVLKKNASLSDTLYHLPRMVKLTLHQTAKIAKVLKGRTLKKTCQNIWQFLFDHVQYERDTIGIEELRSPNRMWMERRADCDCYALSISSILTNLRIRHLFRVIRSAGEKVFHHIYVIVPTKEGHITIDPVLDQFDKEPGYVEKIDNPMDLHFLNGLGEPANEDAGIEIFDDGGLSIDALDLMNGSGILAGDDLGLFNRRKKKKKVPFRDRLKNFGKKVKGAAKKGLHAINRVNPAAGLLRLGVLASMRLNLMDVARRLRWAYVKPNTAMRMGITPAQVKRLQQIRLKIEKIYFGAGGKAKNLQKAILTGKGNADRKIMRPTRLQGFEDTGDDIRSVIGVELFHDEVVTVDGLNGSPLGEVATGSAIAAASVVIAAIKKLLDQLGILKPKGQAAETDLTDDPVSDNVAPDEVIDPEVQAILDENFPGEGDPNREKRGGTSSTDLFNDSVTPPPAVDDPPADVPPPSGDDPDNVNKDDKGWFAKTWETTGGKWGIISGGVVAAGLLTWGTVAAFKAYKAKKASKEKTTKAKAKGSAVNGMRHRSRGKRKVSTPRVELV